MDETKILGTEAIPKLLRKFSLPCVMGLLIGALYNIVDQIFIGNSSLGYLGNAATGISFPLVCIANAFAWCVGDGAASYLSICAGRQDNESAHQCVGTGITVTTLISIVFALGCILFCEPLMVLFGASPDTLKLACDYFLIIAAFFPAYLLFNVMNSMIRADGSPTYAMLALLSGAILNIILDPICIFVLDWGIKGAAIATVVGQVLSFLICCAYLRKPKSFRLQGRSFYPSLTMLKSLIALGGSTFIIQISMVVMTLLSNIMLYKYGSLSIYGSDIPISVFSIQTKVYTIVSNIAVGIALGGQPILGYNYGAGKLQRVKEAYRLIVLASLSIGILATLVFIFCPQIIIGIFGSQNALYMDFAVQSFQISLCLCFITAFIKISSIFFQAIGKPIESMVASITRDMFCFVLTTLTLCQLLEATYPGKGIYGILLAAPISDLVAGSIITLLTLRFFRRLEAPSAVPTTAGSTIMPSHPGIIITIARQHGTCGKQIGALLAQRLGIPCYYKELTALVAQESGFAEKFLAKDYDDPQEKLQELYLGTKVIQQGIIAQEQVLRKIAAEGSCVIVGRAANHVLRHYDKVLRVFLYAPLEYRQQNVQKMYQDSPAEARRHILRSDTSRASYYSSVTGRAWLDMTNYDLCLNANVGKEKIVDCIIQYIQQKPSQGGLH